MTGPDEDEAGGGQGHPLPAARKRATTRSPSIWYAKKGMATTPVPPSSPPAIRPRPMANATRSIAARTELFAPSRVCYA